MAARIHRSGLKVLAVTRVDAGRAFGNDHLRRSKRRQERTRTPDSRSRKNKSRNPFWNKPFVRRPEAPPC
jgi:hypothetical protein